MTKKPKKLNGHRYKSYVFKGNGGDPVLDTVDDWIAESGKTPTQIFTGSGVALGTQRNWKIRKTRRPQFCTIAAVSKYLGKKVIPL